MTVYSFLCRCGNDRMPDTTTCGRNQCAYHQFSTLDPGKQRILIDEGRNWLIANHGVYVCASHVIPALDRLHDGGFPQFWAANQTLTDKPVTYVVVLTHVSANLPLPVAKALDALVDEWLDELAWLAIASLVSPPCADVSQAGKRPERPEDN